MEYWAKPRMARNQIVLLLEYLCGHNVDFIWLAEGRVIDHTTFCKFRTRFRGPLKDLFRQLGKWIAT
jgi:hypothetical protein